MRKRSQSAIARFTAANLITLILGLVPGLTAAEEDLPVKAREVAAKFEAYKETATPAAVEAKRKQVVAYLGSLLKKEASEANLEGALAVKDLMEHYSRSTAAPSRKPIAAEPVTKPQRTGKKLGTAAGGEATFFAIRSDAKRELAFDFDVIAASRSTSRKIRCEIGRASDDSGDQGLHYELLDPSGKVAKKGFLQSSEVDVVTHETTIPGTWRLLIKDEDTTMGGEFPGNSGSVKVVVSPGSVAGGRSPGLASSRR